MNDEFSVESLINKEIDYVYRAVKCKALIAGIAEGVGWTLVRADNPNVELTCWNGPLSPHSANCDLVAFEQAWPLVVEMLKEGFYNGDKIMNDILDRSRCGGSLMCAFR